MGNGRGYSNSLWCSALRGSLLCILKGDGENGALAWFLADCWLPAALTSLAVDCGGMMDFLGKGSAGSVCVSCRSYPGSYFFHLGMGMIIVSDVITVIDASK